MVCIVNSQTDPFFNAAAEEFLLKHFPHDCFMLWINHPSVIIGKHQNTLAEINHNFIIENNIPVVRRLSGGGTVYHDEGNLNFSFITQAEKGKAIDFKTYLNPIVDFFKLLKITVEINPRNNLFIGNKKISGTAAHIYKNKVIHHGTLLFNSSEKSVLKSLEADTEKYNDKSVKSVRSPITNISSHLKQKMKIEEFSEGLKMYLKSHFMCTSESSFSNKDNAEIEFLAKNKYQTWEWNYGYSPAYQFKNLVKINSVETTLQLEVKKGIIEKAEIKGELNLQNIADLFVGLRHKKEDILGVLEKYKIEIGYQHFF